MCHMQDSNFSLDFFQCVLFSWSASHFTGRWCLKYQQDNSLEKITSTISKVPAQSAVDSVKELCDIDKHINEKYGIGIRDNI